MNRDKFMKLLFKPMLAAVLIFFTTSANALLIEISETSDFSGTVITVADTDNDGVAYTVMAELGTWDVDVKGLSSPYIGDEYVDRLHLHSLQVSGGAGTVYIRMTDTGFDKLLAQYTTSFGGVTSGTVSFQSYADAILLSDSGDVSGAFSGTDSGGLNMSGPTP